MENVINSDASIRLTEEENEAYGKVVRITNGLVFVIVDITNSPRILEFGYTSGDNILYYSGDRENPNAGHIFTAYPKTEGDKKQPDILFSSTQNGAIFYCVYNDIELSMEIIMTLKHEDIMILHSIKNNSDKTKLVAIETTTSLSKNGILAIPQNVEDNMSEPNIILSFWPGSNPSDKRFIVGDSYIKLIRDIKGDTVMNSPFKFGINNNSGWAFYITDNFSFSKYYVHDKEGLYPCYKCSFKSLLDTDYITLETSSPFYNIEPGMVAKHAEKWVISKRDYLPNALNDDEIKINVENI